MPIPSSINDLSTTAGSNSPAGTESVVRVDDYFRSHAAFIAELRDGGGSFTQSGTGAVTRTPLSKLREWKSVTDFGATGDGTTDDAADIQAANDACESAGYALFFPPGNYVVKAKLSISCPWYGIPRATTITVPSDFVASGADSVELGIAIKNKGFALSYNSATADYVSLYGIDFVIKKALANLRIGNVSGGLMEECQFSTDTTALVTACFDIYACVRNFTARKCRFAIGTANASGGGAVWVRNITPAGNDSANNTENILLEDCYFSTTTADEAIAVYGVRGKTKNVTIRRCTVEGATSAVAHGTLASTFPLNDGYTISGTSYAAVEGVLWDDCTFIDSNFNNDVLRFGATADSAQTCSDVKARNCRFFVTKSSAATRYVMRAIRCVGYGLSAQDCHITADGSASAITYGIGGFDLVTGCTTSGNITNATYACKVVSDNPRLSAVTGALDCPRVQNNRIFSTSTAVSCTTTDEYGIIGNYIDTDGAGILFNTLGGTTTPAGDAIDNRIVMSAAASFALQASGTTGRLRARGNKVSGTGKTISGTTWAEIAGNDWYGTLDSVRSAGYLDYDHNLATPVGTFAASSSPTAGSSRIHLGWIKEANAGVSGDWQAVYPETANN